MTIQLSTRATEEIHDLYNSVLTKDLKNLHRGIFSIMNTGALLFNQPQLGVSIKIIAGWSRCFICFFVNEI